MASVGGASSTVAPARTYVLGGVRPRETTPTLPPPGLVPTSETEPGGYGHGRLERHGEELTPSARPDGFDKVRAVPWRLRLWTDWLGIDTYAVEKECRTWKRAVAAHWLEGLTTRAAENPTTELGAARKGGYSRADRVRSCGRPMIARVVNAEGETVELGYVSPHCRDRGCPRCAHARGLELRAKLREFRMQRMLDGVDERLLFFVTYTARKPHVDEASCKQAIDRMVGFRQRMIDTHRSRKAGKIWDERVAGSVWSMETVFIPKGTLHKRTDSGIRKYEPARAGYSGWHVHYHCVIELRPPKGKPWQGMKRWTHRRLLELADSWCEHACRGDAGVGGQEWFPLTDKNISQVGKYPFLGAFKTYQQRQSVERAREAFEALHGRRTHSATGTWKPWAKVELEERELKIDVSGVSLEGLFYRALEREDVVWTRQRGEQTEVVAVHSPEEIIARIVDARAQAPPGETHYNTSLTSRLDAISKSLKRERA